MTRPALEPELAAAYVRELSADVQAVLVLGPGGERLAGPEELIAPALALAETIDGDAVLETDAGVAWVGRGEARTLVALAGPGAPPGPTALDVQAANGAAEPPSLTTPTAAQKTALDAALAAI
jgi:hypothetical protein